MTWGKDAIWQDFFSNHQLDKPVSVEIVLEKSQKLAGGGLKDVLISLE